MGLGMIIPWDRRGLRPNGGKDPAIPADRMSMVDRRAEPRMLCADIVEVGWKDGAGQSGHALALLEDISPSGACLQMETALPEAAQVSWESPNQTFSGSVRYCVFREIGYFVGIQFDESCKWSRKTYRPRHLLNPQRLVGTPKSSE